MMTPSPPRQRAAGDSPDLYNPRRLDTSKVAYVCQTSGRTKRPAARQVAGRPSCELTGQATFCVGSSACWIVPQQHRFLSTPAAPAPTPGADWVVRACIVFTGYWRVVTTPFWQPPSQPPWPSQPAKPSATSAYPRSTQPPRHLP